MESRPRTRQLRSPAMVPNPAGDLSRATAERSQSHQFGPGFLLQSMNSNASSKMCRSQFNPELIFLKSSRNGVALPYSHWGGTDHEELGIVPETGSGPPVLRNHRSLSLSQALSFAAPAFWFPARPPSLITCHGRLFFPGQKLMKHYPQRIDLRVEFLLAGEKSEKLSTEPEPRPRPLLADFVGVGVRPEIPPAAGMRHGAVVPTEGLPTLRHRRAARLTQTA